MRTAPSPGALPSPEDQPGSAGRPPLQAEPRSRQGPSGSQPAECPPDTREGPGISELGPFKALRRPRSELSREEVARPGPGRRGPVCRPRGGASPDTRRGAVRLGVLTCQRCFPGQTPPHREVGSGSRTEAAPRSGRGERGRHAGHSLPRRATRQPPTATAACCPRKKPPPLPNASVTAHRNAKTVQKVLRFLQARDKEESFH